jgi:outer membrane receptor protein involved in Fe transport
MQRKFNAVGRIAAIIALGAGSLAAQGTQTGGVTGTVTDAAGKAIANAEIRLTSSALQGVRSARTNASGQFAIRLLPPGQYQIAVSAEGFNGATIEQHIGLGQDYNPKFVLAPVGTTTVEVVAADIAADKAEFKTASNFGKAQIDALPVGHHDLLDIAYLAPGVVENVNSSRGGVNIRGSQGTGNLVMVDGKNIGDNLYGGSRSPLIFDAVDETQVLTGAIPAEFGQIEGGVINSITKSGGNEFTGDLRWDLSNPAWNTYAPKQASGSLPNLLSEEKSLSVGGPIVKDVLWFYVAGYQTNPHETHTIDPGATAVGAPAGQTYIRSIKDLRREIKLTWALNNNNTLTASYHNFSVLTANQDYGAGDFAGLTDLHQTGENYGLDWRSILSNNMTLDMKVGEKKQVLGGGGTRGAALATFNNDDGDAYFNGIFDPNDPGDHRDNITASGKLSWFLTGKGQHELDMGFDYYKGTTQASGVQTPTYATFAGKYLNIAYNFDNLNITNLTADGTANDYLQTYQAVADKATATVLGLFVNDKWTLNEHFNFNLGLRFDDYGSSAQTHGHTASARLLSPRLGMKYDLFGDSAWVVGLAYNRYAGKPMEVILQTVSYVNNPIARQYNYTGPLGANLPLSTLYNLSNYSTTPAVVTNPALNVQIDPNLKPQTVDEFQATLTWNFHNDQLGNGFLRLTGVSKTWSNLIDFTQGNSGQVTDPETGIPLFIQRWYNDPDAKRKYQDLEFDGSLTRGAWNVTGNIVWASLKGNYNGEGRGTPGSGQGLSFFTTQNGVRMYDPNITNPYGALAGDTPLRMRFMASRTAQDALGAIHWGFVYRFDSGEHYSHTRTISAAMLNPALDPQFGTKATQYQDNTRGQFVASSQAYLDLSVQQDFTLMKFGARHLDGFVKLAITNVFNHTQIVTVNSSYKPAAATLNDPWVPASASTFGTASTPANYGGPRVITIATGLKF